MNAFQLPRADYTNFERTSFFKSKIKFVKPPQVLFDTLDKSSSTEGDQQVSEVEVKRLSLGESEGRVVIPQIQAFVQRVQSLVLQTLMELDPDSEYLKTSERMQAGINILPFYTIIIGY